MTTADEIRAEAIERLARGQFDIDETDYATLAMPKREWRDVPEQVRGRYRGDAANLVDALGDLLPTRRETAAKAIALTGWSRRQRYLTEWLEVES